MRTVLACLAAAFLVLAPLAAAGADDAPPVSSVLAQLHASPGEAEEYKASVALHVRLRMFPFIHMTLHGDSWYRRPGLYRFVFRGVPLIARAFSDSRYDLGDPMRWPDRYEIGYAPGSSVAEPVLRLVPKTAALVKYLDVAVDPVHGRIVKATWSRNDGGVITLVQTFMPMAGHQFVAKQTATIDLPRMKAEVVAEYADFDTTEASVATAP